ncbi:MAG TPA: ricin-type beta-trefoil lectin domain protein [Candidatus Sulfotelmatobacter sp.]|nr:ricin-type beta-trefoil lectin domain protein [Candidatus Sulfotelmatobacter sp.]
MFKFKPHKASGFNQKGSGHTSLFYVLALLTIFAIIGIFKNVASHADSNIIQIKSGYAGYCLDDKNSLVANGAPLDLYKCNGSDAQGWQIIDAQIVHSGLCLSVKDNSVTVGAAVVLDSCSNNDPGQVWLVDDQGLYNPNSSLCLSTSSDDPGSRVVISNCSDLGQNEEIWQTNWTSADCPASGEGQKVACSAINEWVSWHEPGANHMALLTSYTDGAPNEEWCADFVSYVYKEAGFPFKGGETNGWDENNANNIVNRGFNAHGLKYQPVVGDVAYFNYAGGHVEIVISSGKTPTFLYGNSATIDPTTGNGDMESNTITSVQGLGSLVYYMSPKAS